MTTWQDFQEQEWYEKQLASKKALGVDYYLEGGFNQKEGRGILINEASWICDDCQGYRHYPDRKWKSLNCSKDYHLGIWVCEKCMHRHGYEQANPNFSVEYFNEVWELGVEEFDNCAWVLPQRAKQLSQYLSIIDDLEALRWIRAKEYGKNDERVNLLDSNRYKMIHDIRLFEIRLLTLKEKFRIVFKRNDLSHDNLYIPLSIYQKERRLPSDLGIIYPPSF